MTKPSVKFHKYILFGVGVISRTRFPALHYKFFGCKEKNSKTKVARVLCVVVDTLLDMIKSSLQFHEYISYGLGVTSRTQSKLLHFMGFGKGINLKQNKTTN